MILDSPLSPPDATRADIGASDSSSRARLPQRGAAADADPPAVALLSVIVPCYNEQDVLSQTHGRLTAALEEIDGVSHEIIYVDDGSTDGTWELLTQLQRRDARVRLLRFSRNFGQQCAVTAGISHACGDAVVLIDADLQDPPEVIAQFVARWRDGWDVVYGVRTERRGESRFKLWLSSRFYRLLDRLSDVHIPLDAGDFRLMDRRVVDALERLPERHRFLRGMVAWVGFRQLPLPYARDARAAGSTKYRLSVLLPLAMDALTSFSIAPLRLATWLGLSAVFAATLVALYGIADSLLMAGESAAWARLLVALLFLGGAQLLAMGLMGEYLGRLLAEAKQRPLYLVAERVGWREGAAASTEAMRLPAYSRAAAVVSR